MILGIGTDIIEIARIDRLYSKFGGRLVRRVFTKSEIDYCEQYARQQRVAKYAKRFAVKEAVVKALGTGFTNHIYFHDIEVGNDRLGKPSVKLAGNIIRYLQQTTDCGKLISCHVSISDSQELAQAFVVIESNA